MQEQTSSPVSAEQIMEQVTVYACTYSSVGGPFDTGDTHDKANEEQAALRAMIEKLAEERDDQASELQILRKHFRERGEILHDITVGEQAAWIEWQHGRGAEAAMRWIHNGLWGPGLIPDENAPWGKEPQAFFDANKAHPFPTCRCGRPSNQLWMGHGACCDEHMEEARREAEGASNG